MYVDRLEFSGGPLDGYELVPDDPQDFSAGQLLGVPTPNDAILVYRKRDDESDYWDFEKRVDPSQVLPIPHN